MIPDIGHNSRYIVCVVSSSVLKTGSLVDHRSGTEGKYLSIASRKRALSKGNISISSCINVPRSTYIAWESQLWVHLGLLPPNL
jgi:hypothetical protein